MGILALPPFASLYSPKDVAAFLDRIEVVGACWEWQRYIQPNGYGQFRRKSWLPEMYAHRVAYILWHGAIPNGLEIDHDCENRACCNPAHLLLKTHKENVLRGMAPTAINARRTECQRGHPFDEANTMYVQGKRLCRACRVASHRRYQEASRDKRQRPGVRPEPDQSQAA